VTEQRLPATRPEFAAVVSEQFARRSLALVEGAAPRILRFPLERSLGKVYVIGALGREPYTEARGNVVLPPGAYVELSLARETSDGDLAALPLAELAPVCLALDLTETAVTDVGLVAVADLTNLDSLTLRSTWVTDDGISALAGLNGLRYVDLSNTAVTGVGLAGLAALTSLQAMNLSYNRVTDAGIAALAVLTNLQTLYLAYTDITDVGLGVLAGLANLQTLYLSGTVLDEGMETLKSRLGGVSVLRQ